MASPFTRAVRRADRWAGGARCDGPPLIRHRSRSDLPSGAFTRFFSEITSREIRPGRGSRSGPHADPELAGGFGDPDDCGPDGPSREVLHSLAFRCIAPRPRNRDRSPKPIPKQGMLPEGIEGCVTSVACMHCKGRVGLRHRFEIVIRRLEVSHCPVPCAARFRRNAQRADRSFRFCVYCAFGGSLRSGRIPRGNASSTSACWRSHRVQDGPAGASATNNGRCGNADFPIS